MVVSIIQVFIALGFVGSFSDPRCLFMLAMQKNRKGRHAGPTTAIEHDGKPDYATSTDHFGDPPAPPQLITIFSRTTVL